MLSQKAKTIAGWTLTALPSFVLLASSVAKFVQPTGFADGFSHFGWHISRAIPLGILELSCTALYLLPRTSILGAILVTGYLGGAVTTHLRIGEPYIYPVILGVMVWGGLYFRNPRVRELIPLID